MKKVLLVALMAMAGLANAEPTAAKKELINKVLQLYQPQMTAAAVQVAQRPVMQMMQQVGPAIQFRVPPEKREALVKAIEGDIKKYTDETVPALRDRVTKFAPSTVGAILDEKFSEDELKQLVAAMESPVVHKFGQLGPELARSLIDKVGPDARSTVEPKIAVMQQSVQSRMNAAMEAGASKPAPAAKPASK